MGTLYGGEEDEEEAAATVIGSWPRGEGCPLSVVLSSARFNSQTAFST